MPRQDSDGTSHRYIASIHSESDNSVMKPPSTVQFRRLSSDARHAELSCNATAATASATSAASAASASLRSSQWQQTIAILSVSASDAQGEAQGTWWTRWTWWKRWTWSSALGHVEVTGYKALRICGACSMPKCNQTRSVSTRVWTRWKGLANGNVAQAFVSFSVLASHGQSLCFLLRPRAFHESPLGCI